MPPNSVADTAMPMSKAFYCSARADERVPSGHCRAMAAMMTTDEPDEPKPAASQSAARLGDGISRCRRP